MGFGCNLPPLPTPLGIKRPGGLIGFLLRHTRDNKHCSGNYNNDDNVIRGGGSDDDDDCGEEQRGP